MKSWNGKNANKEALACVMSHGYKHGTIYRTHYKAHRVAWALFYGEWPKHTIDHINGIRTDNRISNLRDVPHAVNTRNRHDKNADRGVSFHKSSGGWQAFIGDRGHKHLGVFGTKGEAMASRKAAEIELGYYQHGGRNG